MNRSVCFILLAALLWGTSGATEDAKAPSVAEILAQAETMPVKDLLALTEGLRPIVSRRLLTPAAEIKAKYAAYADKPDSGVHRLLQRGLFDGVTVERGGGCYFSFTTQSNDYDREPDLELQQDSFSSGFAGGDEGRVVEVPGIELGSLTLAQVPPALLDPDPQNLRDVPGWNAPQAVVGHAYAVRSVRWGESDLVAAFQVVDKDENGITFV